MRPYYNDIAGLFSDIKGFYDINEDILDYNNIMIYELEYIENGKAISLGQNSYKITINLYYIDNQDHSNKAINILRVLEGYNARAIVNMLTSKMVINADEYIVSKYQLVFENWRYSNAN
ncbi:MAG: hypothetical protein RBS16_01885 [Candidatus Cloacimonadales bacterium]|jgi:hypothetical protein|nr:hypothetical protein [Candidatus Cloacimonadota bacterium]MDX9976763.1 hypothetical protein [Candidatus Cloacimonadales bacterium]